VAASALTGHVTDPREYVSGLIDGLDKRASA
jgi:hypothetical protein